MNVRDKHLAHSLTQTYRERQSGQVAAMGHGDEREILAASLPIAEALYCWVNGIDFNLSDSREIDRKNAEALWKGCTFKVLK